MSDEHIIEVSSEAERRQLQARRESDRDLGSRVAVLERAASEYRLSIALSAQMQRERRFAVHKAAALLMSSGRSRFLDWNVALETSEKMLNELERKDSANAG